MFACITLAINVAITGLIVGRLLYHRQFIQDALGREHGSRYMRIITMCIESAALVVGFNLVLIVLVLVKAQENAALILLQMMAQIYTISPFLILFRISHGRVHHNPTLEFRVQNAEDVINRDIPLQFAVANSPESTMISDAS
ncbi:hypothetical protein JR316_0007306 [Psilocybe cubensis]|uniref:Uncharacterized protein n=1 Tax=Psilocybe cubensis TaxID=181762 RepID=A0ACB8GYQ3_PSICU|nr:hypothetical protein JR316_0007306 [Psilocybe cubensis]KAH9480706.1 hypothetical protein JR316_0007306 [Psilocybe cubensis]